MGNACRDRVTIDYLAHHRAAVPAVVDWLSEQWFRDWHFSRRQAIDEVCGRLNVSCLPMTLVALADGKPIGTASLVEDDNPVSWGSVYCLTGVYVAAPWRQRGVGRLLCQRAVLEARRLRVPGLALLTKDCEPFYARLGWHKVTDVAFPNGPRLEFFAFMNFGAG